MSVFPNNTVLTFTTDQISSNRDKSGNPIIQKVEFTLQASFKVDKGRQYRAIVEPGSDPNLIYFVGYCIKPKFLPASVKLNSKAKCIVKDLASGATQVGEFTVTMITQTRWKQVPKALGAKFEGYFIHA